MRFQELWNLDISQIWDLTDHNELIIAMSSWIERKSNFGENMDVLTQEEQTFIICNHLEGEVNNGGFSQYLYNSSGNNAHRIAECMEAIGAVRTAQICRTAMAAFDRPIPHNWAERQDFLDEYLTDEVEEILDECDERFYAYEDNLELLNYLYIQANKDRFR